MLSVGRIKSRDDNLPILWSTGGSGPVFDLDVFEASEVLGVGGHQDELVYVGNRGNLAIDIRTGLAKCLQAGALVAVPGGGGFVVRQNGKRCADDMLEVVFQNHATLSGRQTAASIREFVPDRRRNGTRRAVHPETSYHIDVRLLGDRRRRDVRIQKIP